MLKLHFLYSTLISVRKQNLNHMHKITKVSFLLLSLREL